jgi:hypothetical protein
MLIVWMISRKLYNRFTIKIFITVYACLSTQIPVLPTQKNHFFQLKAQQARIDNIIEDSEGNITDIIINRKRKRNTIVKEKTKTINAIKKKQIMKVKTKQLFKIEKKHTVIQRQSTIHTTKRKVVIKLKQQNVNSNFIIFDLGANKGQFLHQKSCQEAIERKMWVASDNIDRRLSWAFTSAGVPYFENRWPWDDPQKNRWARTYKQDLENIARELAEEYQGKDSLYDTIKLWPTPKVVVWFFYHSDALVDHKILNSVIYAPLLKNNRGEGKDIELNILSQENIEKCCFRVYRHQTEFKYGEIKNDDCYDKLYATNSEPETTN